MGLDPHFRPRAAGKHPRSMTVQPDTGRPLPNDWDGRRHVTPTCWHAAGLACSPAGLGAGARPCRDRAAGWGRPMDRDFGPAPRGDDTRPISSRSVTSLRCAGRAGSADRRGCRLDADRDKGCPDLGILRCPPAGRYAGLLVYVLDPNGASAGMVSIRVVFGTVKAKSAPNAAAGLSAPRGGWVRVSSTARMLAAAVKA
jgi:hypothetical protein